MSRRHRPTASAERPPGTAEYWALEMSEWGSELEPEFTLVYPGAAKDVVEIDEGRVLHKPKHELREDDPRRASLQAKRQALLEKLRDGHNRRAEAQRQLGVRLPGGAAARHSADSYARLSASRP